MAQVQLDRSFAFKVGTVGIDDDASVDRAVGLVTILDRERGVVGPVQRVHTTITTTNTAVARTREVLMLGVQVR